MTTLIITEKHKQAQSFAKVLGANEKNTRFDRGSIGYYERKGGSNCADVGHIKGDEHVIVSWAAGHLLRTAMPDQIDDKMKRWRMEDLPFFPEKWKFLPAAEEPAKSQWKVVKELLDDNDVDTIYIATDSDREGCLIYHLCYINSTAWKRKGLKQYRCWYIEFTEKAVRKALEEAKPQSEYDDLVNASVARMKFDYSYGCNMSRAYTIYHHSTRNVGRVVSSVLYLIVKRQEEIDNFVPENYLTIKLPLKNGDKAFTAEKKMTDIAAGEALAKTLKGEDAVITKVEKKTENEYRKLFNTTKLMSAAAKKGMTVKQIEKVLQDLWDMGAISYPRTKAETLLEAQVEDLAGLPDKVYKDVFASPKHCSPSDFDLKRAVGKGGKSAEEASHTGLYPTEQGVSLYSSKIKGDPNLRTVFLMIACRFLCAIMPGRVVDKTSVVVVAKGEEFTATGTVEVSAGFNDFEKYVNAAIGSKKERAKADNSLPDIVEGEHYVCGTPKTAKKQTNPPKQYDEASLLSAMESAAQFVEDKKLKEMLKDVGIGTAASRAGIISTVKNGGYVDIKSGRFYPTDKTKTLMESIPEELKTPVMTAKMELQLDEISRGDLDKDKFLGEAEAMITEEVAKVKAMPPIPDTERYKDNKVFVKGACPKCGADVVETDRSMVCRNNCGFVMWRTVAKKKIPKTELKAMLETGHTTAKIEGFKSKAGKDFACWLYVDADGDVKFDFDDNGAKAKKENVVALAAKKE